MPVTVFFATREVAAIISYGVLGNVIYFFSHFLEAGRRLQQGNLCRIGNEIALVIDRYFEPRVRLQTMHDRLCTARSSHAFDVNRINRECGRFLVAHLAGLLVGSPIA